MKKSLKELAALLQIKSNKDGKTYIKITKCSKSKNLHEYFYLNIIEITLRIKLVELGLKGSLGSTQCFLPAFKGK